MKLKKYVALTAVLMVLSPITEFTTNANSQVVQASKNSHHEKSTAKIHKYSLWAFNSSTQKVMHITVWKKAHKVITGPAGTFTFSRLYYFPAVHKWEPTTIFKTKAKAKKAMLKYIKEEAKIEQETAKENNQD